VVLEEVDGPDFDEEAALREMQELQAGLGLGPDPGPGAQQKGIAAGVGGLVFDRMPTEEELEEARRTTPAVPYDDEEEDEEEETGRDAKSSSSSSSSGKGGSRGGGGAAGAGEEGDGETYHAGRRQTLLFSATALRADASSEPHGKGKKGKQWLDKVRVQI
jgi:hypothetical protein